MQKPYKHTELSSTVCYKPQCNTRIKANVVARKPEGARILCYPHFQQERKKHGRG